MAHQADCSSPASVNSNGVRTKKSEMWIAGLAKRYTSLQQDNGCKVCQRGDSSSSTLGSKWRPCKMADG